MSSLRDFYNNAVYANNVTIDAIFNAVQPQLDFLNEKSTRYFLNHFPQHADLQGIARFEYELGIIPNPQTEDLEFRRTRVLTQRAVLNASTEAALKDVLENIFGKGNVELLVDYRKLELTINIWSKTDRIFQSILHTIRLSIPSNTRLYTAVFMEQDMTTTNVLTVPITFDYLNIVTSPVKTPIFETEPPDEEEDEVQTLIIRKNKYNIPSQSTIRDTIDIPTKRYDLRAVRFINKTNSNYISMRLFDTFENYEIYSSREATSLHDNLTLPAEDGNSTEDNKGNLYIELSNLGQGDIDVDVEIKVLNLR